MKWVTDKYIMGVQMAAEAVVANKLRSALTALGIIFGVAAVIAMLAIGSGAKQEILEQMKWVGVNNIVITPKQKDADMPQDSEADKSHKKAKEQLSSGLRLHDAIAISKQLPNISAMSVEVNNENTTIYGANSMKTNLSGVHAPYFEIYHLEIESGRLMSPYQYEYAKQVCVIGHQVELRLFQGASAVGKEIKCGKLWLKVVGVLKARATGGAEASAKLHLNDFDQSVFAPVNTVLLRYHDRSVITAASLHADDEGEGASATAGNNTVVNRNQLDKIIVQVEDTQQLHALSEVLANMLLRRHAGVQDFNVTVPELLLKQEQKTRSIFNLVLGAIASISLIVGGIGIMNIMLASVMERIREIGVRRAIGATKHDVVFQFLAEAILISVTGGVIGILLGVVLSKVISYLTNIPTIIGLLSIVVSFGVSVAIGIVFGYMPAQKAAQKDPVNSLRHE